MGVLTVHKITTFARPPSVETLHKSARREGCNFILHNPIYKYTLYISSCYFTLHYTLKSITNHHRRHGQTDCGQIIFLIWPAAEGGHAGQWASGILFPAFM